MWEAGEIPGRLLVAVGTDGNSDVSGSDAKFRIAEVGPATGRVVARSPWQVAREPYRCTGSTALVVCSGSDTTALISLHDPSLSPTPMTFAFGRTGLHPISARRSTSPIFQLQGFGEGADLIVGGWANSDSGQAYVVTRYAADGKVRWTRSFDQLQQSFGYPQVGGILDMHDDTLWLRLADNENRGVAVDLATGKPITLDKVTLGRVGRATVTSSGLEHHTFINGRDLGSQVPVVLGSQLTAGPTPVFLVSADGPGPGPADSQVGVDARDDASGAQRWTRPGVVPEALCGGRLVIRDPMLASDLANQRDNSLDPLAMTIVDAGTGKRVARFSTIRIADGMLFCAPGERLVIVEPTRVRTIDLNTGKDQSTVPAPGNFGEPVDGSLLVSDSSGQTVRLVR